MHNYKLIGLFCIPVFHQGGSLGYLLTPYFGYLLGIYPLVRIIDSLNKKNRISTFEFHFRDSLGRPRDYSYRLSKEDAGVLLLFPSELLHTVYPFYDCDEDRISVSGNILLNTSKLV